MTSPPPTSSLPPSRSAGSASAGDSSSVDLIHQRPQSPVVKAGDRSSFDFIGGLKDSDVDSFVEDVLVNGKPWASGEPEVLAG
ncbi:sucrase/ferredoxin-like family protein [Actinidia rufa]|uniref:Sucrase/ferredoxin-like family protein n=1 Tax=Actinidia rufa TaxID=165716 RepID=A0A7J0F288_9ERIC|nr:sucrase/ferredoxin-like family protein [Actinidia rufa]